MQAVFRLPPSLVPSSLVPPPSSPPPSFLVPAPFFLRSPLRVFSDGGVEDGVGWSLRRPSFLSDGGRSLALWLSFLCLLLRFSRPFGGASSTGEGNFDSLFSCFFPFCEPFRVCDRMSAKNENYVGCSKSGATRPTSGRTRLSSGRVEIDRRERG